MTPRASLTFCQFFFLLLTAAVAQESGAACKTSGDQDGKCIAILNCPSILSLIRDTPNLLKASILPQVRQTHCGEFDGVHHVCCELPIIHPSEEQSNDSVEAGLATLRRERCGTNDANRVANGVDTVLSEYPWMALLQYRSDSVTSFDCGGSLITSQYVLTAAHCIKVAAKQLVAVRLGEHNLSDAIDCRVGRTTTTCAPPVQDIAVEEAIYHKDFNIKNFHNDVGLIRLARKATIESSVKPICLPVTPFAKATQITRLLISGWGRMETGQRANILQKALVSPIENADCQKTFSSLVITENQMCAAGENEVDACKGDSGGPAFYSSRYLRGARFVQYGIVSAGVIQCGSKYPGIYVRVLSYLDWIAGNIKP